MSRFRLLQLWGGTRVIHGALISILAISTLLTFQSCSTQKAKWGNIRFHNLTCHYNVWWNGNESLKAGIVKLDATVKDDYTLLLPPYKIGSEEESRTVYPEMDRAVEKGVKGIKQHSIYVGGTEHVPYIKECYLLTAYATFYKQDYASTANTCNILVTQFSGIRAGDEGAVLLARCMTMEKRYAEAEVTLDQLGGDLEKGNFSRSEREKLYMAMVECLIPQHKYRKTVEYIHLALASTHSRQTKARLYFLLAQIYQQQEKRPVAAKYYRQSLHYSTDYVMEFNARLGEASCASSDDTDIRRLERQLDAMLRDKKNIEFRDQIHYAKGEMYYGVKDAQKACDEFRKSVAAATVNRSQKAKSALRLAEILYNLYEDYDQAQLYYDIAVRNIPVDRSDYKTIKRRSDMLTELCSYTRVYQHCDSILRVASLPEAERNKLIQDRIDTLRAQEERARIQELIKEMSAESLSDQNALVGDWYFYNSNSVQKGKETFRQRWGLRQLEDNWFLSNKISFASFLQADTSQDNLADDSDTIKNDSINSQQTALNTGNPNDPHSPAYYLKDLPRTQHDYDSIDSLTSLSLLGAGYVFYHGVNNIARSMECYLRMATEYTNHEDVVHAFYMLYRIFDQQGNTPQANYYRDMVLMGFPDSDFANLIRDNEYYKELQRRERLIDESYAELYDSYQRGRYSTVISLVDQAEERYDGHSMLPKFRLWKALALAQSGNKADALKTLEEIIGSVSSGDSLATIAQYQYRLISNGDFEGESRIENHTDRTLATAADGQARQTGIEQQKIETPAVGATDTDELPEEARLYRYRENQQYYVVIIINDRTIKATELQYKISDFNSQYYTNSGYRVNAALFTDTTQLLTIHRFMTEKEALSYYSHILSADDSPLRRYPDSDHQEFAISTQNYATFFNRKNINAYLAFFRKYHLKK